MKRIFAIIIGCVLTLPAFAGDDKSVSVEFIWGIGGTTSNKGFTIRAGQDNAEVHIAHWFGTRGNTAVGIGLTASTEGNGQRNDEFFHASGTAGLSYVFQTNSVLSNHFQPYLRLTAGANVASEGDLEVEFSYLRYGFEVAEQFGAIGLRVNDRYNPAPESVTSQDVPDDGDDGDDDSDNDDDGCESNPDGCGDDSDDDDSDDDDSDDGDGNNGHGNDDDGCDESNPGNGGSCEG